MIKKLALGMLSFELAVAAYAATPGSDNANDPAYVSGWTNGTDGGTAATFGPWTLTPSPNSTNAGFLIGDSTTLSAGNTGGNINTSGKSFELFGFDSGGNADATRAFDSALTVGQEFSLDLAVNFLNGVKGFDLLVGTTSKFELNMGNSSYTVFNSNSNGDIFGDAYSSNTVFHLDFLQTSLTGGTWTITRSGGLTGTATGTYNGDPTGFHLYDHQTSGGGAPEDSLYVNNLLVVPEPTTLSLLVASSLLGAWFFVRRSRA
jgi:hypothetical protein